MFTAYFKSYGDLFNINNKVDDKAKLFLNTFHTLFVFCLLILLSSCSTKYPDTQRSGSYGVNSQPVSSKTRVGGTRGVRRPVATPRQASPRHYSVESPVESQSSPQPQQPEIINTPRKVINISSLNNWLFEASEQGNVNAIWRLLGQGADITASNTNGETALHSAAAHNQVDVARLLIERGADVNALTISGWSPLHSAARFGSVDVVAALLQSGVNIHHRNTAGRTALSLAQQAKQADVIRILQSR